MRNLTVTVSPHIHDGSSTRRIMLDVIIATIPALVAATILFGPLALLLTAVTISAAVLFEWTSRRIMKRDTSSIFDLTAVITGLILALSIPANIPLWVAVISAGVAIVAVKQFFGGVGRNLLNPAMVGHAVAMQFAPRFVDPLGYPIAMTWLESSNYLGVDTVTMATPLQLLADGVPLPGFVELFLGVRPGTVGETSIPALLLGGTYLVWRRVISPVIPLTYIGTTLLVVTLAGQNPLIHLLSGSLVFVAIFMATDYTTSPINFKGRIIFGIGCGLITALTRLYGGSTEGTTSAIIAMNLLVPFIERLTLPKAFGYRRS